MFFLVDLTFYMPKIYRLDFILFFMQRQFNASDSITFTLRFSVEKQVQQIQNSTHVLQ